MADLGARVTKLERVVAPSQPPRPTNVFFLVWGRDTKEISAAVRDCVERDQIDADTPIASGIWPHAETAPAPRWTDLTQVSDLELNTLHDIVSEQVAHQHAAEH
jgi:hypothetical protein